MAESKENLLGISWHDSAWIPILNPSNALDYFTERTNPFYDRTCNNEVVKMQRLNPEQLNNMTGLEYILLHAQEPILYVIRKQHRHSATQVTPLADYYIIAGVVYQAPDVGAVLNSRVLSTINHLQAAFDEAISYSRYHPSQGYWWEFKEKESQEKEKAAKKKDKAKEEPSSIFQRKRVDILLGELSKKFPPKLSQPSAAPPAENNKLSADDSKSDTSKVEVKQEKTETSSDQRVKPPPEKKPRFN